MPLLAINKARRLAPPPPDPALYVVANRQLPAFIRDARSALGAGMSRRALEEVLRLAANASTEHSIRLLRAGMRARGLPPAPALVDMVALGVADAPGTALDSAYTRVLEDGAAHGWGQVAKRKRSLRVPVNPASVAWARDRGSRLVREISARQRETIRRVVARGLQQGLRADTMAASIRRSVGLLAREEAAVDRRRNLLLARGLDESEADSRADSYAEELREARALRIARTETVAAQNQGLLDGWKEAQEAGELPEDVQREWVSAPESPNPDRPCEICLALDGQRVRLDEPFVSADVGQIMAPTAHPGCRCTQVLRRGTKD